MITLEELRAHLEGRPLPGGSLRFEPYESMIANQALLVPDWQPDAHPIWFVVASLRAMGISVDELRALARAEPDDTLLLGGVELTHEAPMAAGHTYRIAAEVESVGRRSARDGSTLDSVAIRVHITDADDQPVGTVVSTYLFKRAAQ